MAAGEAAGVFVDPFDAVVGSKRGGDGLDDEEDEEAKRATAAPAAKKPRLKFGESEHTPLLTLEIGLTHGRCTREPHHTFVDICEAPNQLWCEVSPQT